MSVCLYENEGQNYEDTKNGKVQDSNEKSSSKSNSELLETEKQLQQAESQCNSLKQQLDYMKQLYGANDTCVKTGTTKSRKISSIIPIKNTTEENTKKLLPKKTPVIASRQKSTAIETDNSGGAVNTINTILTGITNSVNRVSEIHTKMLTPRTQPSNKIPSPVAELPNPKDILQNLENQIHKSIISTEQKPKSASQSNRNDSVVANKNILKTKVASSQMILKQLSKIKKRNRPTTTRHSGCHLERKSSAILRNRYLNKPVPRKNDKSKVIEIYHNTGVKKTKSNESNIRKSRQADDGINTEKVLSLNLNLDDNISNVSHKRPFIDSNKSFPNYFIHGTNQNNNNNNNNNEFNLIKMASENTHSYNRNYELPTVASRMKQEAKRYLGTLNLKTIPFCCAISTTQSHNIGLNIQQVMNIIKNRQPINGISPTLAHNIRLAAKKINCTQFSELVSTITSRIGQTPSTCPLSKTHFNLHQLQEQAKLIPEETIEEIDEETVIDGSDIKTLTITGPSGDVQIETKDTAIWTDDKNATTCTCIDPLNPSIQPKPKKYDTKTELSINSQLTENQSKPVLKSLRLRNTPFNPKLSTASSVQSREQKTNNKEPGNENSLKKREKNLRSVLQNLHDDFDRLNKKYEELSKVRDDSDATNQLEVLNTELNKKEAEITMVMGLYKEVLALKQQVKQLKEKKSQGNLRLIERKDLKANFKGCNNPEAAFHLTKLLKQIQHYQTKYKSSSRGRNND